MLPVVNSGLETTLCSSRVRSERGSCHCYYSAGQVSGAVDVLISKLPGDALKHATASLRQALFFVWDLACHPLLRGLILAVSCFVMTPKALRSSQGGCLGT